MSDAISFLLLPFAASVAFVLIHAYLGVHVLRRNVIFADLALAQLSALGATVGSLITGTIFQAYGGTMAFYWSLVPIAVLAVSMLVLDALEKRAVSVSSAMDSATSSV